jgi:prevent-host-death family protein
MTTSITLAKAKAQLSACVRAAEQGDAFIITRHGKPVAAIVAPAKLEHLLRLRQAGPEGGLASLRSPARAVAPIA